MRHPIAIKINGKTYNAVVVETDFTAILSAVFFSPKERYLLQTDGPTAADKQMRDRLARMLAAEVENARENPENDTEEKVLKAANEALNDTVQNALIARMSTQRSTRLDIAQALDELFGGVVPEIEYKEYVDQEGNLHRNGRIRLDMHELLDVVVAVLNSGAGLLDKKPVKPLVENLQPSANTEIPYEEEVHKAVEEMVTKSAESEVVEEAPVVCEMKPPVPVVELEVIQDMVLDPVAEYRSHIEKMSNDDRAVLFRTTDVEEIIRRHVEANSGTISPVTQ